MRSIKVERPTRLYQRFGGPNSSMLAQITHEGTGENLGLVESETVMIGDPVSMVYDHRDQLAAPVLTEGFGGTFVLMKDFPELTETHNSPAH